MDSNCKKKSSRGQGGESRRRRDSNLPKCLIYRLNIDIDNNPCFRYRDANWFCLSDASIGGAKADADTQLTVFDSSASEKQLLIFRIIRFRYRTRYFTESGIIGSKAFVAKNYQRFKHLFHSKREKRPKPIRGLDGMYSLKGLSEGI